MLIEANRALVARRNVELHDGLSLAICPGVSGGEEPLGESTSVPGVLNVERFDLDPLMVAPHIGIVMNGGQGESTRLVGARLKRDEADGLVAAQRLLNRRVEARFPRLRERESWVQGRIEGVELAEQQLDRR